MNEFQRRLVDKSIEGVRPKADQIATLFFSRLSQTSPRFRYHFSADGHAHMARWLESALDE